VESNDIYSDKVYERKTRKRHLDASLIDAQKGIILLLGVSFRNDNQSMQKEA